MTVIQPAFDITPDQLKGITTGAYEISSAVIKNKETGRIVSHAKKVSNLTDKSTSNMTQSVAQKAASLSKLVKNNPRVSVSAVVGVAAVGAGCYAYRKLRSPRVEPSENLSELGELEQALDEAIMHWKQAASEQSMNLETIAHLKFTWSSYREHLENAGLSKGVKYESFQQELKSYVEKLEQYNPSQTQISNSSDIATISELIERQHNVFKNAA